MTKLFLTVLTLLLLCACARAPVPATQQVPEEPPLPPLCLAEPDCGDDLCFIGVSDPWPTQVSAMQDARRDAYSRLVNHVLGNFDRYWLCYDCPQPRKPSRSLKKKLAVELFQHSRLVDRVAFSRDTQNGTEHQACVQLRIGQKQVGQVVEKALSERGE